ncbi:protein CIA1-like isoform X4 [Ipomoea triloba]|nr:protein CIA1-like isoform X4 [Ipomoea triloba]
MVQWHPSVDILFSCSYDNTIKVWAEEGDSDDWHCIQTLAESSSGHTSTVWALSFNFSGDKMVTCSDDLTLKIWSADIARLQSGDVNAPCGAADDDAIRLFVENEDKSVLLYLSKK